MISLKDLYNVLAQVVPLYVAMIVAYGSVKWWKIFSPDQCSGINRFVALFAVPLLSFNFISNNNPYAMNYRFIAADTLQKLIVLFILFLWCKLGPKGGTDSLELSITLFSLSTLPNTLVMGIPLLKGMYGDSSATLMVQIVVLQCIVWYTLMLFLFEIRGARVLISQKFPGNSALISSFKVDSDVVSLDGREPLETEASVGEDGKLHVKVRKSTSSRLLTSTPSNLTNVEIYSLHSSKRVSNYNEADNFYSVVNSGRKSGSLIRNLGVDEEKDIGGVDRVFSFGSRRFSGVQGGGYPGPSTVGIFLPAEGPTAVATVVKEGSGKGLHVFKGSAEYDQNVNPKDYDNYGRDGLKLESKSSKNGPEIEGPMLSKLRSTSTAKVQSKTAAEPEPKPTAMPPATVMTKLILMMVSRKLIRNPNTYSSLIGLVWSLISFRWQVEMPTIVANSIKILSNGGLGMAMFSLGLFMALQPRIIAGGNAMAAYAAVVRFIVGPVIMAAASAAVGLRGALLQVAIVQASLPQGIVPFVFAKEYNVHPDILSTAVIFGMLIALPITLVYYILLGLIK